MFVASLDAKSSLKHRTLVTLRNAVSHLPAQSNRCTPALTK
uniref:Uncharacterized protein n=1 Tax=Anguilla anguilla TaxID=7936 RepID=A0A0E9XKT3_ANGAN